MLKKIFKRFDIFAASPLLRVKGESEVTNSCGGVFSVVITVGFLYMFISALITVFSYKDIEVSETIRVIEIIYQTDRNMEETIEASTFAFGIRGIDLWAKRDIFTVNGMWIVVAGDNTLSAGPISMVPCKK